MTYEDFCSCFTRVWTCFTEPASPSSTTPCLEALSHKDYHGSWMPGHPTAGAGGGPRHSTFLTNPHYPINVEHNDTYMRVSLDRVDRMWGHNPSSVYIPAGFILVRLKGIKPRLTRYHPSKVAATSGCLMNGPHLTAEMVLASGRYAIVPFTREPLQRPESFKLSVAARGVVEWEQVDEDDEDILMSDDEGKWEEKELPLLHERLALEDDSRLIDTVHKQVAELAQLVEMMRSEVKLKDAAVAAQTGEGVKYSFRCKDI
ncbi:unnamed protein product [Chrysoparadoxa australica]